MQTVTIDPSQLVVGALRFLGGAGVEAILTTTNVRPVVAAATDLLRALGVPATPAPQALPGPLTGTGRTGAGCARRRAFWPSPFIPGLWAHGGIWRADGADLLAERCLSRRLRREGCEGQR